MFKIQKFANLSELKFYWRKTKISKEARLILVLYNPKDVGNCYNTLMKCISVYEAIIILNTAPLGCDNDHQILGAAGLTARSAISSSRRVSISS